MSKREIYRKLKEIHAAGKLAELAAFIAVSKRQAYHWLAKTRNIPAWHWKSIEEIHRTLN